MGLNPKAGKKIEKSDLTNITQLLNAYYKNKPNMDEPSQHVIFGTSGHRGSSLTFSFTESHIIAISQAICEYRKIEGITGPLFMGKDTHALSTPAEKSALQVFAANNITVMIDKDQGFTPTPVISHAILAYNNKRDGDLADGVVITPSHNPPTDGGFKYNPPHGGPADTQTTNWIAARANEILYNHNQDVSSMHYPDALSAANTIKYDFITPYVKDLSTVIDMDKIRDSNVSICADVMGGSGLRYWSVIRDTYNLNMNIRNDISDPTFAFMHYDHDGKTRMDCSSAYAMAGLIELKDKYDIAFGNDPDFDRHGIVSPSVGLLNPNHFLAVSIHYLFTHRIDWDQNIAIGKTLVSSSLIDRLANDINRSLQEVPVGFKWFVNGLLNGSYGFGGEESAGASFLRQDGTVWTTDKDGIILSLLACEICAVTKKDPGEYYQELASRYGAPFYSRIDTPATLEEKDKLSKLTAENVTVDDLAGEAIISIIVHAPANQAPIGGLKICTKNGWFAARPSGTEDLYKLYAESFIGEEHLVQIQEEAKAIIANALQ